MPAPAPAPAEPTQSSNNSTSGPVRPDAQLAHWGMRQHRQVTTAQLHAVGLESDDIVYRVRTGRLHPVFAEVYSLGGPPRTDRERWMAAVLTFGAGTRLSDASAAELHGWLRYPVGELHVTTTTERDPRDGIVPHHRTRSVHWRYIDHIPVTGPEQTILDCAATLKSDRALRRVIRQAQVDKHTTHARLAAFALLHRGARGVARMKRQLADGPSPTRSANEDDVLELLRHAGRILPNHVIDGDEVDLYLPDHNTAIEVDSPLHDNPTARADDAAKQARLQARGIRVRRIR